MGLACAMNVVARPALLAFWRKHPDAEQPLKAWYAEAVKAAWKTPQDIKRSYPSTSFLADNRVIFNLCGNKYRLITAVADQFGAIYIKFIGTHAEYDKIDAAKVAPS